jgi:hypothetical protein
MGPFIGGYRAWLAGWGYTPGTIVSMLAMAGGLGRWMDARGIAPGDLDRAVVTEFRGAMRAAGMRCVPGAHGLIPCSSAWTTGASLAGLPRPRRRPESEDRRGEPGAAASRSGHYRPLRQRGLRRPAHGCSALARGGAMTALAGAARDYLRLRNSLGHDLAGYHRELPRFVAFLEAGACPPSPSPRRWPGPKDPAPARPPASRRGG